MPCDSESPTYFRDSETGLDYAQNRYHSPGQGRFLTVDPYGDNWEPSDPGSWNSYGYANGDPINNLDPEGLFTCGEVVFQGEGPFKGKTFEQIMTGHSGEELFAQLIWHEGGTIYNSDIENGDGYIQDLVGIGTAILNQWDVDNGRIQLQDPTFGTRLCPLGACANRTLFQLLTTTLLASDGRGQVFDKNGNMRTPEKNELTRILNTTYTDRPTINGINIGCQSVTNSINVANYLLTGGQRLTTSRGTVILAWDKASPDSNTHPLAKQGWVAVQGTREVGHTFWGIDPPVRNPVRRPRGKPSR